MKSKRHSKILELIRTHEIDTQEELLRLLKTEGFDVTQATVSRDIKNLFLIKMLTPDGRYKYAIGRNTGKDATTKFYTLLRDSFVSVGCAQNIVVIRCSTGMAQAVCASMDALRWEGVVGTLAGDDTIFVAMQDNTGAVGLAEELQKRAK